MEFHRQEIYTKRLVPSFGTRRVEKCVSLSVRYCAHDKKLYAFSLN
jgi:hypothetical protein